jgi:RHS repeat-associated protein
MSKAWGRLAACGVALGLGLWSGAALAQQVGTRASGFGYDPGSGLLTREVVEPDLAAYRLQTDYGYDAFGNKTVVTVSGADIATRTASTTYDARGQFALSSANALGQSESFTYDPRFGLPLTHTGPNGLTTQWQYDGFGRKLLEIRPDGTRTRWSYRYCTGTAGGTDACPAGAVAVQETRILASDDATLIAPTTKTYQDQLGRAIAGDTQGFDGATIRGVTEHDELGRVKRKSRPFFLDGGTPLWTTTDYDGLSRPVLVTEPDGTTSATSYSGLITIGTNAAGQTKTVIKDSQGQQVSVTDAEGNTATFGYDPFGNLARAVDPQGNIASNTYDRRGRKIATNDPDMGSWSYSYNVLDQLVSQTDAKGQTATLSYDLLGRTIQRIEPDLTSTWTYDTAANGIGKLASASTNGGFVRSHSYDALGRPTDTQISIDGASYASSTAYDALSRVSGISYPSGLQVAYGYNALGFQTNLTNSGTGEVYWTANTRDAELRLIQQTSGNGVVTTQSYHPLTGDLQAIQAGPGNAVQNFGFGYDLIGNITSRSDANTGLSETFTYDSLNRLRSATVGLDVAKTVTYDTIGNIISKSDVGTYSYPAPGQPFPHALSSVTGSVINTTFTYDANGNQTGGNGLAVNYASFNKPNSISRGTTTIGFAHDPQHQRYKQTAPGKEVLYLNAGGVLVEKITGTSGSVTWNNYLFVAGKMVGMRVERSSGEVDTRYFHRDHLGSVAILTDDAGNVVERLSYDAWGKRRQPNGQDDPAGALASQTTRGFTGHEQLDDVGLIHMNGRVYDPLLGRFGTPDPMTESPFSTQGWNRYSYVGNSPLNFSDPSGYCFAGCFWQKPFKALGKLLNKFPIIGDILKIAAVGVCQIVTFGGCTVIMPIIASAFVAGVRSGSLGQALRAGLMATASAAAFYGAGELTGAVDGAIAGAGGGYSITPGSAAHVFNIAGHAAVGCLMATASGGKCGPGALSGAVSAFAGPMLGKLNSQGKLIANSVIGGLASIAGGGKFGNGAVTAAFRYLYNDLLHERELWAETTSKEREGNPWDRLFTLTMNAGSDGGYVIQRMTTVEVGPDGKPIRTDWYEAFRIEAGQFRAESDTWYLGTKWQEGIFNGSATYYEGMTRNHLLLFGFKAPSNLEQNFAAEQRAGARLSFPLTNPDQELSFSPFKGTNTWTDTWRHPR